jgi:hypothetical protein
MHKKGACKLSTYCKSFETNRFFFHFCFYCYAQPNCRTVRRLFCWNLNGRQEAPLGCHISKFWVWSASSWPKRLREPEFQLSSFQGGGCRLDTNFVLQRRVTDGKKISLKSCFLAIKSPKTWKSAIKKIS